MGGDERQVSPRSRRARNEKASVGLSAGPYRPGASWLRPRCSRHTVSSSMLARRSPPAAARPLRQSIGRIASFSCLGCVLIARPPPGHARRPVAGIHDPCGPRMRKTDVEWPGTSRPRRLGAQSRDLPGVLASWLSIEYDAFPLFGEVSSRYARSEFTPIFACHSYVRFISRINF
jgi:hypothetical protein